MILLATCLSILANVPVDYKLVQNIYVIYNLEISGDQATVCIR